MKALDAVKQLQLTLPQMTNLFSDELSVLGITVSGNIATVNCVGHGLSAGNVFSITGASTLLPITSFTRNGDIGIIETVTNHDIIKDEVQIKAEGRIKITTEGATQSEFNGEFDLFDRPNRTHLEIKMEDSGPLSATGNPVLVNGTAYGFNGTFNVASVIDADNFTYELPSDDVPGPAGGTILLRKSHRIRRVVNFDRSFSSYTKQEENKLWMFVAIGDNFASKDRHTQSDALAVLGRTNDFRQQVVFPLDLYVYVPTSNSLSGASARDLMEDVFPMICKSLIGKKFDSYLASKDQNNIVFSTHGTIAYDTAKYVHQFQFQTTADIQFEDSVGYDFSVAFLDVSITMEPVFSLEDEDC